MTEYESYTLCLYMWKKMKRDLRVHQYYLQSDFNYGQKNCLDLFKKAIAEELLDEYGPGVIEYGRNTCSFCECALSKTSDSRFKCHECPLFKKWGLPSREIVRKCTSKYSPYHKLHCDLARTFEEFYAEVEKMIHLVEIRFQEFLLNE